MTIKTVDAKTLKQWMDAKEALLIDVREPDEYEAERIPGSVLLPLAEVSSNNLPKLNNKKLVVHCKLGKRGSVACEKLLAQNSDLEIYNLQGGIKSWIEEGYAIQSK